MPDFYSPENGVTRLPHLSQPNNVPVTSDTNTNSTQSSATTSSSRWQNIRKYFGGGPEAKSMLSRLESQTSPQISDSSAEAIRSEWKKEMDIDTTGSATIETNLTALAKSDTFPNDVGANPK